MAESTELVAPKEKKVKTFSKHDWQSVAEHIIEEWSRRKRKRADDEMRWKEVDRQLAMEPVRAPTDPAWMPDLELGWQSQTHETLVSDCRRLIFPSDRNFFACKAALATLEDVRRINFDSFAGGRGLTDVQVRALPAVPRTIRAHGEQMFADRLPVAMLEKFHQLYDFRSAVDGLNAEAIKYGAYVGHVKWVTDETVNDDFSGGRPSRYPALVPCSMWTTFLDDSPAKLFAEGIRVGPGIIRTYNMRLSDLRLAAKEGSKDVTDPMGGWRRQAIATVDESMKDGTRDHVQIIRFDGDLIVPRSGKDSIFLPNVIIDVCDQGPCVVRYRERDLPFVPYIIGYYHRDSLLSPYASSPMIKGVPIQNAATRALREWLACASLHARPPVRYNPYDPNYTKQGGPELVPGATWPAHTSPDVVLVGDPTAIMAGYMDLRRQYEEETGVNPVRLGQQTKSHQTAFAIDQEMTRGMVRTVDYVSASLHGGLRTFLYMEYEMARQVGEVSLFMPAYGGFVVASGQNLPKTVEFSIAGAGAPIDERERRNNELAAMQALIATAPAAVQAGGRAPDINAIQEDIARLGGLQDRLDRYFPTPAGVAGISQRTFVGPAIPGVTAGLPAPAGA